MTPLVRKCDINRKSSQPIEWENAHVMDYDDGFATIYMFANQTFIANGMFVFGQQFQHENHLFIAFQYQML